MWKQLGGLELLSKQKATFKQQKDNVHPLLSLRRPSFLRWPEHIVSGSEPLVPGHLEFWCIVWLLLQLNVDGNYLCVKSVGGRGGGPRKVYVNSWR